MAAIHHQLARETDEYVIGSMLKMCGELPDPTSVPHLLKWAKSADDFHCLDAVDALARIGDEQVVPIAKRLLLQDRPPVRRSETGSMSSVHTIRDLVRKSLRESPNRALRKLGR